MSVNTKHVDGRRAVEFSSYQEILDDARALCEVPTRQLGNWSLGKICNHLAAAIDMGIDGAAFRPALVIRLVGPFLKKRFLSRPMSPGFQLPSNAKSLLPGDTDAREGLAQLERAIARIQQATELKPHPVFGRLTRQEWDRLCFLHSAMHLSFIVPE